MRIHGTIHVLRANKKSLFGVIWRIKRRIHGIKVWHLPNHKKADTKNRKTWVQSDDMNHECTGRLRRNVWGVAILGDKSPSDNCVIKGGYFKTCFHL